MGRGSFRTLLVLGALAGLSFFLLEEEEESPLRSGPSAEVQNIVLDRFGGESRIRLSAARAVFSPDGFLRLEEPKLRAWRRGGDLVLESAEGEMAPEYEVLVLREIEGEAGSSPPLAFYGEEMRYRVGTGELSGGAADFRRDGQKFSAGSFTYSPEEGVKFTDGVRGVFATPQKSR